MRRTLDATYYKSDLNKVMVDQCQHLYPKELERLLQLLCKFEYLFDGTLGMWKTAPVELE